MSIPGPYEKLNPIFQATSSGISIEIIGSVAQKNQGNFPTMISLQRGNSVTEIPYLEIPKKDSLTLKVVDYPLGVPQGKGSFVFDDGELQVQKGSIILEGGQFARLNGIGMNPTSNIQIFVDKNQREDCRCSYVSFNSGGKLISATQASIKLSFDKDDRLLNSQGVVHILQQSAIVTIENKDNSLIPKVTANLQGNDGNVILLNGGLDGGATIQVKNENGVPKVDYQDINPSPRRENLVNFEEPQRVTDLVISPKINGKSILEEKGFITRIPLQILMMREGTTTIPEWEKPRAIKEVEYSGKIIKPLLNREYSGKIINSPPNRLSLKNLM